MSSLQTVSERNDRLEVGLYNLVKRYHGIYEKIAEQTGCQAAKLRQAMNPYYLERPSFIKRAADVFAAWIRLHPRSGLQAFRSLVSYVMQAAPDGITRRQLQMIELHINEVTREIEAVNNGIESIPAVRLQCREIVRRRQRRSSSHGGQKRPKSK